MFLGAEIDHVLADLPQPLGSIHILSSFRRGLLGAIGIVESTLIFNGILKAAVEAGLSSMPRSLDEKDKDRLDDPESRIFLVHVPVQLSGNRT